MRDYKPKPGTKGLTRKGLIAFECPVCRRIVWVKKSARGTVVGCGECTAEIRVPEEEGAESEILKRPAVAFEGEGRATLPERRSDTLPTDRKRPAKPADPAPERVRPAPIKKPVRERKIAATPKAKDAHRLNPKTKPTMRALDDVISEGEERPEWQVQDPHLADRLNMDEEVKRWTMVQLVTFGLVFFLVVGGVIGFFSFYGARTETVPDTNVERAAWRKTSLDADAATRTLKKFFFAESLAERLDYVRHPETTESRIESFYALPGNRGTADITVVGEPITVRRFELEGIPFLGVLYDFSDLTQRGVVFEKTLGGWKIDWESFVGYSEMPWSVFFEAEPEDAFTFRALVKEDSYFNFGYGDEATLACYQFFDPFKDHSCWGYCVRGDEIDTALREAIAVAESAGLAEAEVMVRLRFEESGKGRNQVWIDEFVRSGHLMP